ncbi:asparagine synthase (glutamine-hydrolyzing) [Megalodesulfovibrio paquesii]
MCGICGFVGFRDDALLQCMMARLQHRGPDQAGEYCTDQISLGHRRLSIIDLTTGGQPIFNENGMVVVVYNGEIYNYIELRQDLERQGHRFTTATDTEVIVHAYEEYGPACVERFNGEFAFALWDAATQTLLLARDRLGIRPLFYWTDGARLAFSSEIRSLLALPQARGPLSAEGLGAYLTLRYVPESGTLIEGVHSLPQGTVLLHRNSGTATHQYWTPLPAAVQAKTEREWEEGFRELLEDSVRLRMRGDVPIGAYLSGGIDSASIVALMQRHSDLPVRTFTIGGFGAEVDELEAAAALSRHIGTMHTTLSVDASQYSLLSKVAASMSKPIGDAITLPTWLLARATAQHVKVVLSGEGADEILAGYVHHLALKRGNALRQVLPGWIFLLAARGLGWVSGGWLDKFFPYPAALGEKGKRKLQQLASALARRDVGEQYLRIAALFSEEEKRGLLAGGAGAAWAGDQRLLALLRGRLHGGTGLLSTLLRFDIENWLADYTLAKQDAMAMAHSLEARVPFLDHRLVEYCLAVPDGLKIQGRRNKCILREAMRGILPDQTVDAPKKAFYIPFERCFGRDFDDYVRDVLLSRRCLERGIFNAKRLTERLGTVRSAELVDNKQVMALLILELWLQAHVDEVAA